MRKSLRDIILSTFISVIILNFFTGDTKTRKLDIEEKIAIYFSIRNTIYRTEIIIGDTISGNETGYDSKGDTTYCLIDINGDKKPDIARYYITNINRIYECRSE